MQENFTKFVIYIKILLLLLFYVIVQTDMVIAQSLKPKINNFTDSEALIESEEHVNLNKPDYSALITVSKGLNPLGLDS